MEYTYSSGSKYVGDIVNDNFEGKGIFYYSNGDIYNGEFKNDMFNGEGEYTYKNGDRYQGFFVNDKFHGVGTYYYKDGCIEKGKFNEDKRLGKFFQKDNEQHYSIIYDKDRFIKLDNVDEHTIPEDKKPC